MSSKSSERYPLSLRERAGVRFKGRTVAARSAASDPSLFRRERAGVRGPIFAVLLLTAAAAAASPSPADEVLGTWNGTSTCVKSPEFPSCHDEVVVYEFRKAASDADAVTLAAFKIVNGEKQLMGEMDFTRDAKLGAWVSEFQSARYHGRWSFVVRDGEITGTLVDLPSNHLVRNVSVRREKAPAR